MQQAAHHTCDALHMCTGTWFCSTGCTCAYGLTVLVPFQRPAALSQLRTRAGPDHQGHGTGFPAHLAVRLGANSFTLDIVRRNGRASYPRYLRKVPPSHS